QGRSAEFGGGIQATQAQARMACDVLHVNFDQPVSLKEGHKGDKSPQVEKLLCDGKAHVYDVSYEGDDPKAKLLKYQRLESTVITFETLEPEASEEVRKAAPANPGHKVYASGGGKLILVHRGGVDPLAPPDATPGATKPAAPPKADAKPADPDQLKLTRVDF